mgnify:CR=1 FL=1|jgi:Arc/MetJ-type ribon-helix-helix transcriptional regulator
MGDYPNDIHVRVSDEVADGIEELETGRPEFENDSQVVRYLIRESLKREHDDAIRQV